jgi:nitroreductase
MTEEEERKLFEATVHAPTSFNIQHWRFVVLRDPELRAKIRKEFGNGQAQMTNASLLVLFTADTKAWKKQPERYWRTRHGKWPTCWSGGWDPSMRDVSGSSATRRSARSAWRCRR